MRQQRRENERERQTTLIFSLTSTSSRQIFASFETSERAITGKYHLFSDRESILSLFSLRGICCYCYSRSLARSADGSIEFVVTQTERRKARHNRISFGQMSFFISVQCQNESSSLRLSTPLILVDIVDLNRWEIMAKYLLERRDHYSSRAMNSLKCFY